MIAEWPAGGAILKTLKGDLKPTAVTGLRVQHAEVQAIAGFLEVQKHSVHKSSSSFSTSSFASSLFSSSSSSSPPPFSSQTSLSSTRGRIAVYGDSSCFEVSSFTQSDTGCKKLFASFLNFTLTGSILKDLQNFDRNSVNDGSSLYTELSQYELLTEKRYFMPLLLNASQPVTKIEKMALKTERRGRAWEFSRYSR